MIDFEPCAFTLPPLHISVGLGVHVAPLVGPEPVTPAYSRVELSVGTRWRLGVVGELAVHQAADRWGESPSTVVSGDTYVFDVGASVRREVVAGPVRVYPNAVLGLMVGSALPVRDRHAAQAQRLRVPLHIDRAGAVGPRRS